MGRSCFDGYLTPECANCPDWMDGTPNENGEWSIGCGSRWPLDMCPAFRKMSEEEKNQKTE